jgi:uncharacterized protein YciI
MKGTYLLTFEPTRKNFSSGSTDEEKAIINQHFFYLKNLLDTGVLIFAGRTDESSPLGIVIIETKTEQSAENILNNDPAIVNKVFRGQVKKFRLSLKK